MTITGSFFLNVSHFASCVSIASYSLIYSLNRVHNVPSLPLCGHLHIYSYLSPSFVIIAERVLTFTQNSPTKKYMFAFPEQGSCIVCLLGSCKTRLSLFDSHLPPAYYVLSIAHSSFHFSYAVCISVSLFYFGEPKSGHCAVNYTHDVCTLDYTPKSVFSLASNHMSL